MTLPMNRVTFITLAVRDLARARAYYEALGWVLERAMDEVAFYAMNGAKFGLFTLAGLARETGREIAELQTGAMTLAQNQPSEAEVDAMFAHYGILPNLLPFSFMIRRASSICNVRLGK